MSFKWITLGNEPIHVNAAGETKVGESHASYGIIQNYHNILLHLFSVFKTVTMKIPPNQIQQNLWKNWLNISV
jgi:hypothetical protein